jgi:2-polyprenyl-3-methyl-5-hydroxy-6-metoxy-1,4-benzoquinol methylase
LGSESAAEVLRQLEEVSRIKPDGERVCPFWSDDCYKAHLSIYVFASRFCQDSDVLDVGSGTGYGSAYLVGNGARSVVGLELDASAILFSEIFYNRNNLSFLQMDAQNITIKDKFDLIISTNVIEHIPDVEAFFKKTLELLAPNGRLIIAVPCIANDITLAQDRQNPFHVNHWSPTEWVDVLRKYFKNIQLYNHWHDWIGVDLQFGVNRFGSADFTFKKVSDFDAPTITAIFVCDGSI